MASKLISGEHHVFSLLFLGMDDVLPNRSPYIPKIMKVSYILHHLFVNQVKVWPVPDQTIYRVVYLEVA